MKDQAATQVQCLGSIGWKEKTTPTSCTQIPAGMPMHEWACTEINTLNAVNIENKMLEVNLDKKLISTSTAL